MQKDKKLPTHKTAHLQTAQTDTRPNSTDSGESGHEIFILETQTDGNWKIARYTGSLAK